MLKVKEDIKHQFVNKMLGLSPGATPFSKKSPDFKPPDVGLPLANYQPIETLSLPSNCKYVAARKIACINERMYQT